MNIPDGGKRPVFRKRARPDPDSDFKAMAAITLFVAIELILVAALGALAYLTLQN